MAATPSTRLTIPPGEQPPSVTTEDVRRVLQRVMLQKVAGIDNMPGRVLKDCAYQLSED